MRRRLALAVLPLLAGCVEQHIEQGQIRSVLVDAGLSPDTAQCMARRLVDRLSARQLHKLETLQGPRRSLGEYIAALQRIDDPEVVRVTIGSAALCATGLEG